VPQIRSPRDPGSLQPRVEKLIGGHFDGDRVDGRRHPGHVSLEKQIPGTDRFARYRRGKKKGTWEFVGTYRVQRRAQG
jgi:hypothetical protein